MSRRPHGRGLYLGKMSTAHLNGPTLRLRRPPPGIFCKSYRCHSMACLDRPGLEFGDKIIMPQAAFQEASVRGLVSIRALEARAIVWYKYMVLMIYRIDVIAVEVGGILGSVSGRGRLLIACRGKDENPCGAFWYEQQVTVCWKRRELRLDTATGSRCTYSEAAYVPGMKQQGRAPCTMCMGIFSRAKCLTALLRPVRNTYIGRGFSLILLPQHYKHRLILRNYILVEFTGVACGG